MPEGRIQTPAGKDMLLESLAIPDVKSVWQQPAPVFGGGATVQPSEKFGVVSVRSAPDDCIGWNELVVDTHKLVQRLHKGLVVGDKVLKDCLLYTSPSPRDLSTSRMPSSA